MKGWCTFMRKNPTRHKHEVTQTYNSGTLTVFDVSDAAEPGHQPVEQLTPKGVLRYEERRLGMNRLYAARQVQVELARVVRTPYRPEVSPQDVVIDQWDKVYRIDAVQLALDVFPPSMDLSLSRTEQKYEVRHGLV